MNNSIVSEGKTTAEATEKGLKELNISKDKVDIEILEETEKRSFYSILSPRVVKVRITVKEGVEREIKPKTTEPKAIEKEGKETKEENIEKKDKKYNQDIDQINNAKNQIEIFLKEFLSNREGITHDIKIENYAIYIDIQGTNINFLIGYRGETINAMQTIITSIANKNSNEKIKIFLDIAGYKEKREKTLQDLAHKIEKTVIRTKKQLVLEPMTAYERKIIHTELQNSQQVKTLSRGEEPYRKVVVTLK